MKIISTSWSFFQKHESEWIVMKDGCRIMVSNICEYIGKKETSYLFIGSSAVPDMSYGNICILDNRKYLPGNRRTNENIGEWQDALKSIFREYLRIIQPDCVLIHDLGEFSINCMRICDEEGQIFAYVNHLFIGRRGGDIFDENHKWEDIIYSNKRWKTIAVGSGVKRRILEEHPGIEEEQIHVIPNGTSLCGEIAKSDMDGRYDLYGKKVLVCVGSLQPRKNQLQLVSAFARLSKEYKEKIVIFFCGKDSVREPVSTQLLNEIKKNGFEKNLIYLGECTEDDMKKIYTRADGLIMPSLSEGLSLVVTEMLSYGRPIIMFSDNETAEDINDNKATILVTNHSDQALADAMIEWYKKDWNEEYIRQYSRYFSMERVADDYISYCLSSR